jgi:hypothetical protein
MKLKYNTDLYKTYPQTMDYKDFMELRKSKEYIQILSSIMNYCISIDKRIVLHKPAIDRILSFYLIPQNYNDNTHPSIYKDGIQRLSLISLVNWEIISIHFINYNTYYLFTDRIEKIIKRELNLQELIGS